MNQHQPFENWIFQEAPLSEQERSSLDQHLIQCDQCCRLNAGWQATHRAIRETVLLKPSQGFSQRWQNSLAERRSRIQKEQIKRFFKYLVGINLFSFAGLILTFILGTSPLDLLSGFLQNSITLFLYGKQIQNLLIVAFNSMPLLVPVVLWILVSTGFCLAVLVWGGAMYRFFIKGAVTK